MREAVRALARAGCLLVQLRAKELSPAELLEWAKDARRIANAEGIRLIVNDRVDVARIAGADGVHLGQGDLSASSARKILGGEAIIGLSAHDVDQARRAEAEPVDYVAIGPVFETGSKASPGPVVGLEGARAAREVVAKPLVAIGGITLDRAASVLSTGVDGLAVISALRTTSEGRSLESVARTWLSISPTGGRGGAKESKEEQ
jgi:thiamine-phosphate pyrophosphorylase